MRPSPILSTAARILTPLLMLFSIFLLFRGHYEPGGGFVGGLVAAAAFVLEAKADGAAEARRMLRARPTALIGAGLALALASGLVGLLAKAPFLAGGWIDAKLPIVGRPGTPVAFDVGVYLVVLGTVTAVIFALMEDEQRSPRGEDAA